MTTKFQKGEVVVERIRPMQQLTVKRYKDGLYYCITTERVRSKELVYFEKELSSLRNAAVPAS